MLVGEAMKVSDVVHILGTDIEEEDLEVELALMFPDRRKVVPQQVQQLHACLRWLSRMRRTLRDSSALLALAKNVVCSSTNSNATLTRSNVRKSTQLDMLAERLVSMGEKQEDLLQTFADTSAEFYQCCEPYCDALQAADQLGAPKAPDLLRFLQQIDGDLRELVDSGDDKAELDDAISSLIKVYAVLRPLLKCSPTALHGNELAALEMLRKQLRHQQMQGTELATHLQACLDNVQGLKRTYNNFTQKGEQTKENIHTVIQSGVFVFQAHVNVVVRCGLGLNLNKEKLNDLRSRALLEVNTKQTSTDTPAEHNKVLCFLDLLRTSTSINKSLVALCALGHFEAYSFSREARSLKELKALNNELHLQCTSWRKTIETTREQEYLLSFFCSQQLWHLYNKLCAGGESISANHLLCYVPTARTCIMPCGTTHPLVVDLTDDEPLIPQSNDVDGSEPSAHERLVELGVALHKCFAEAKPYHRIPAVWIRHSHHAIVGSGEIAVCFVQQGVCSSAMIESCLAVYATDGELPSRSQLLFCSVDTTCEELDAFLFRAFHANMSILMRGRLFCILYVGALPEVIFLYLKERMQSLYQRVRPRCVRLALLCEEAEQHRIGSGLSNFIKTLESLANEEIAQVLQSDCHVVIVTSDHAGLGKTTRIKALAREQSCQNLCSVTVSGLTTRAEFVDTLMVAFSSRALDALHINVLDAHPRCATLINDILFELLCLRTICCNPVSKASLVHIPCTTIYLELANSVDTDLLERLPICRHYEHLHLTWDPDGDNPLVMSDSISSDVQLVANYLRALEQGNLNGDFDSSATTGLDGSLAAAPALLQSVEYWQLLHRHFLNRIPVGQQPSFAQVDVFISVLAQQLRSFRASPLFFFWLLQEGGHLDVRRIVVQGLVESAAKFALRSVNCFIDATQEGSVEQMLSVQSFKELDYALLLMQPEGGLTPFPNSQVFGQAAPAVSRYYEEQRRASLPHYRTISQSQLFEELLNFVPGAHRHADELRAKHAQLAYMLTADNLLKMMLIFVRLTTGVPVIISGETGCGKTSLIKFLAMVCGLPNTNFCVLSMHAGITKEEIITFVRKCEMQANSTSQEVWIFFDEVNTSEHVGLVSEVVCRRILQGTAISNSLRFLSAVNPYRLRVKEVKSVGLQSKLNTEDPMRRLVYRVHPLPGTMLDYVWDYGCLTDLDEDSYITAMLADSLMPDLERKLVVESQCFVRHEEEDCSVSLRDVRRFKRLVSWFHHTRQQRVAADAADDDSGPGALHWWDTQVKSLFFSQADSKETHADKEVAIVLALAI